MERTELNKKIGQNIRKYRLKIQENVDVILTTGDTYCIPENFPHSFEVIEKGEVIDFFTPIREDYL